MGTIRSLKLAKPSKKELEKTLEKNRVERESLRAQIEKNKKEKAAEKKKAEENEMKKAGKDLKKCSKLALKKTSKLGKVEAAPKEVIAPRVEAAAVSFLTGTDGAYQLRPSRLPMPRIYVRAELEKREEARRARKSRPEVEAERRPCSNVRLVKEEGGLDLFTKNEEARRVQREWMRAEREKKEKKEEEERKKEQEKKREQERQLAKQIEDGFESLRNGLTEAKKLVVKKRSKRCQSVVKKMASIEKTTERVPSVAARAVPVAAESAWTGTEAPYQSRAEMKCLGLEKSWAELEAERRDLLRKRELLRAEIKKKREMEEERIKRAEKQVEKSERLMKEMREEILIKNARKEAIVASVVKKGESESDSDPGCESASPTGVLQERFSFGSFESCSSASSV